AGTDAWCCINSRTTAGGTNTEPKSAANRSVRSTLINVVIAVVLLTVITAGSNRAQERFRGAPEDRPPNLAHRRAWECGGGPVHQGRLFLQSGQTCCAASGEASVEKQPDSQIKKHFTC